MILTIDDPKQNELLTTLSTDLDPLEHEDVFRKLETMISLYVDACGLAAPQIGILKRAFVVRWVGKIYRFANAEIIEGSDQEYGIEGCLSIPEREFYVPRCRSIVVKDDINGTQRYEGFLARIIQHENDHTKGVTLKQSGLEVT